MGNTVIAISMSALIALCTCGCMTTQAQDGPQPTLDDYRRGHPVLVLQVQDWDKRFVPTESSRTFDIINGTDEGKTVEVTVSSSSDDRWSISYEGRSAFDWSLSEAGIICTSTRDVASGTTSTFTPPLAVVPRDLKPDVPYTAAGKIMVTSTATPSSKIASGTWTVSITHDADVTLELGGTNYECTRLRTKYDADLGLATVTRTAYDYYAPDAGWVARVFTQDVVKVIIPEKTNGTWVLK
jgi:hypothetical protein